MKSISMSYDLSFDDWKKKDLAKALYAQYPDIFDKDDLKIALNQKQYHFYEWVAAVNFYEQGYKVLVEQYIYKSHFRKNEVIKEYLGEEGLKFLRKSKTQAPDLFIYKDKFFFFAEVKSKSDKLRTSQGKFFQEIEKKFATEILLVKLGYKQ